MNCHDFPIGSRVRFKSSYKDPIHGELCMDEFEGTIVNYDEEFVYSRVDRVIHKEEHTVLKEGEVVSVEYGAIWPFWELSVKRLED